MKKILLILMFPCISILSSAQDFHQQKIDSVCGLVKKYFNEKNADQIYALAGKAFKNSLSEQAFKNVCNNNLFPLGEIKQTVLENYENGVWKYKAIFNSATLTLLLSLDEEDKIAIFLFKPYSDEKAKKNYKVPSTNSLTTPL